MISAHLGWNEPLSGLAFGAACAALAGLVSGWVLLRYHGLAFLMLTLATAILLQELANTLEDWTGGFDGLTGITIDPVLGVFENDLWGHHYYWYSLIVLFLCFLVFRRLVHSPFGRSLTGVRENTRRMHAIGAPVHRRLVVAYTISAAMAGLAGALFAQQNQFVTLDVLSFARSGTVLIVLILGGTGRLYGALVGAVVYVTLEDELAKLSPEFWEFGVGLVLVLTVLFFRGGLLGAPEVVAARLRARARAAPGTGRDGGAGAGAGAGMTPGARDRPILTGASARSTSPGTSAWRSRPGPGTRSSGRTGRARRPSSTSSPGRSVRTAGGSSPAART